MDQHVASGTVLCGVFTLVLGCLLQLIYKRHACNARLPPGSMGLPIIGETFEFFKSNPSLDTPDFYKLRFKRYGPLFKTSLLGKPVVVSRDMEVNRFIFRQDKLFQLWYPEATNSIIGKKSIASFNGSLHKYIRSMAAPYFAPKNLKDVFISEIECVITESLGRWANQPSIEVNEAVKNMIFDLAAKKIIGFKPMSQETRDLRKQFDVFYQGLMSFPLYVPGTKFYRSMQEEHEAMLKKRENKESTMTWEELKSLKFTTQVTNEVARLTSNGPGIFRKTLKDVQVNGYTIPAGWLVLISPVAVHLNPEYFEDPLTFNPWRWQEANGSTLMRNFIPFGDGTRHCIGAEFSKVVISVFLHKLVTKYRWKKIKGGDVYRISELVFPQGYHIQLFQRS